MGKSSKGGLKGGKGGKKGGKGTNPFAAGNKGVLNPKGGKDSERKGY